MRRFPAVVLLYRYGVVRPRKFDEETRAALIRCTAEQIVTGGVESVSLRPVAAQHECSTTAIYMMFGSRERRERRVAACLGTRIFTEHTVEQISASIWAGVHGWITLATAWWW